MQRGVDRTTAMERSTRSKAGPLRTRSPLDRLSWDNLRLLLMLSETGSFRSAAIHAGIALNTLRAKIDRLELQFGTPLLMRSVEGIRLTQEGYELVAIARQMQRLGRTAHRVHQPDDQRNPSQVRIVVTEGLGTFWLVPQLVEFRAVNPAIKVELHCDMTPPDVLFRDTDVAIQLTRPNSPGLMVQSVGTVHAIPFATPDYLARHGTPTSLADVEGHHLVWQQSDQIADETTPPSIDPAAFERMIVLRTNTSSAHYWAVAQGAGIGFLPTYARAFDALPQALDIGLRVKREVFLVYNPDALQLAPVKSAIDWLRGSFDGLRFPWFARDFVHPDDFEAKLTVEDAKLFPGFTRR